MFAVMISLACSTPPPVVRTPLPPPLPVTPGAYAALLEVIESLPASRSEQGRVMQDQVRDGVVPEDVELSHKDLGEVLSAEGLQAPILDFDDVGPEYSRLLLLTDAAILESRVHLAYGEGAYAWGALAPVLDIATKLQAAGGGLLPFAVGIAIESRVLLELEQVLQTPYGLGKEGEAGLAAYLLSRQALSSTVAYAIYTECEATAEMMRDPMTGADVGPFFDLEDTLALHFAHCDAQVAMLGKPYPRRSPVPMDLPSFSLFNQAGVTLLGVMMPDSASMGAREAAVQAQRALLQSAAALRAGHQEAWPVDAVVLDPSTAAPVAWDGTTLQAGTEDFVVTLAPVPPVWTQTPRPPQDAEAGALEEVP